jgi:hypothetical protein
MPEDLKTIIAKAKKNLSKPEEEVIKWENLYYQAVKSAKEIKESIEKSGPDDQIQGVFSFIPTEMTRVSPFFPMNRGKMKNRPIKELTWENSWGKISITGKQLSIYDESVLMAVLYLVRKNQSIAFETTRGELCRVMNVSKNNSTYNAVWSSLERLTGTTINLHVWSPERGKGKRQKTKIQMVNPMLSGAQRDKETGKIRISLNEYFLTVYGEGLFTSIDLKLRQKLRGDVTKSLYRFVVGQREKEYQCHLLTIAKAVNVNLDLETREIRKRIKRGLQGLKSNKIIKDYKLTKSDIILIKK